MSEEAPYNFAEQEKMTEYISGTIDYSVIGQSGDQKPVLVIPGFTEGRMVLRNFATELAHEGNREVIIPDQPRIDKYANVPVINLHAEALLAVLKAEGLLDKPIDLIAHSLGALVAVKMAELAKERGIKAFESSEGSHAIFVAPAGSNAKENIAFLGGRFAKFMINGKKYGKELDPTGEMMKAGIDNFFRSPAKTVKEILTLQKKSSIYKGLGKLGLKPFVFSYSADDLFPQRVTDSVMKESQDSLTGYAMPVDSGVVGATNFNQFKAKTGLRGKAARKAWAHHYRNAGHNDLLFHPKRTVKSILQILD